MSLTNYLKTMVVATTLSAALGPNSSSFAKDPVRVAVIADLSGAASNTANELQIQTALNVARSASATSNIEYIVYDSQSDPQNLAQYCQEVSAKDQVVFVIMASQLISGPRLCGPIFDRFDTFSIFLQSSFFDASGPPYDASLFLAPDKRDSIKKLVDWVKDEKRSDNSISIFYDKRSTISSMRQEIPEAKEIEYMEELYKSNLLDNYNFSNNAKSLYLVDNLDFDLISLFGPHIHWVTAGALAAPDVEKWQKLLEEHGRVTGGNSSGTPVGLAAKILTAIEVFAATEVLEGSFDLGLFRGGSKFLRDEVIKRGAIETTLGPIQFGDKGFLINLDVQVVSAKSSLPSADEVGDSCNCDGSSECPQGFEIFSESKDSCCGSSSECPQSFLLQ